MQQKNGTEYWYYNMGEPQKHGKWKKPDAKEYITSDPTYMRRQERQIHRVRKQIGGFSKAESGSRVWVLTGLRKFGQGVGRGRGVGSGYENVLKLDCVIAGQLCKLTKNITELYIYNGGF